jgi:hypothetical protein
MNFSAHLNVPPPSNISQFTRDSFNTKPSLAVLSQIISFFLIALFEGCTTERAQYDVSVMRQHAMDYYNDQIMDNLIAAKNGVAFIHVDLSSLQALITTKLSGTVNGGQSFVDTGQTVYTHHAPVDSIVNTVARAATRPFTFSVSPEQDIGITIGTTPLTGNPIVYEAYCSFNFGHVVNAGRGKPKANFVPGTLRKWNDGNYYYIPLAYKKEYFNLCKTIFERKEPSGGTVEGKQKELEQQLQRNKSEIEGLRLQQQSQ